MSSFTSILDAHFADPVSNEQETVFRALKRLHPEAHLQHVGYLHRYGEALNLLDYLKSENVDLLVEAADLHEGLRWNSGAVIEDGRSSKGEGDENATKKLKGRLVRYIRTGILHFEYQGTKFKAYQVSWTKDRIPYTFYDFVFEHNYASDTEVAEDEELLYKYTPRNNRNLASARLDTPAHRLLTAAHRWSDVTKEEIWVFQGGFWSKDKSLHKAISKASWSDLTLPADFLENLRTDTHTFFSSREVYEELGVTWKRGLLMLGPPGNGKTESVKVLLRESGQTALYVKSFTTSCGPENGVETIFSHARAHAPCILVIEDLDSLVTPEVKSFFLNELDGLADNAGILTIATTNHPELIDDAILNRPSRFDVKYTFDCPNEELRKLYIEKWMEKAGDARKNHQGDKLSEEAQKTKGIIITFKEKEKTALEVAKRTDGWSYAFLKELFVSFLLRLAHDKVKEIHSETDATLTASTSPDSVLLDQVEKLAIQVAHAGVEDNPGSSGGRSKTQIPNFARGAVYNNLAAALMGATAPQESMWR